MDSFDVISAVELTAAAAIVVAVASIALGRSPALRLNIVLALGAWFAVITALAAMGALRYNLRPGIPSVGLAVFIPLVLMWLALMRVPALRDGLDRAPLSSLVAVHAVRLLGVNFLLLHAAGRLPAPFAPVAGWGDIIAAVAAAAVACMVHRHANGWRGALLAWNVFGLADLAAAVTLGVLSAPGPLRRIYAEPGTGLIQNLPWLLIPGFLVPLLATSHLVIFQRLMRPSRAQIEPPGRRSAPSMQ